MSVMNTPIFDYVKSYCEKNPLRLHMPGHKGKGFLGVEKYDITEINGADSLFEANGIIKESEKNASFLFGCNTFYSTEGSSLCIRGMLYLALRGEKEPLVIAGRNAHKTFISAAALLDFDIEWIYSSGNYLSCEISPSIVENAIISARKKPSAVYLTSPDYLGNMLDIEGISKVCKKYKVLLLVDNAHGAYLKFLNSSKHPSDLGADMCCDSAHKTLPCLTGGAYLHISENADSYFKENAKEALSLFASTSPSYLILQSLDLVNKYISEEYSDILLKHVEKIQSFKKELEKKGFSLYGNEPLKITINAKKYGYTGIEIAKILEKNMIFSEFYDNDFIVFMFTPQIDGFSDLTESLFSLEKKEEIKKVFGAIDKPKKVMSIRKAMLSEKEYISVEKSEGRILASSSVGCPPAVPIAVCGEIITENIINAFNYYGVEKCFVVK